jgi:uncharacterized C2H2 Zn-finger protein
MATKWQLTLAKRNELQEALAKIQSQIDYMETTDCEMSCSKCGTYFEKEKDFWDHFEVSAADVRAGLWNLGSCPKKVA